MNVHPWLSAIIVLALAAPLGGVAAAAEAEATPVSGAPAVWLDGPFGRVAAGSTESPATTPLSGVALDTLVRDAPLSIDVDVPFEDLTLVEVVARSHAVDGADLTLSDGATVFDGPPDPGQYVIVATIGSEPFGTTRHAWLVDVPDRQNTPEAMLDVTAPQIELISDAGSVLGAAGDGCYMLLCADMGRLPPPDVLDPLAVGIGETLTLRTVDGSGLAGWTGRLTPLDGTQIDGVQARGPTAGTVESAHALSGLEAPAAGQWMLEVRADFDRDRGYQWQIFRLHAR